MQLRVHGASALSIWSTKSSSLMLDIPAPPWTSSEGAQMESRRRSIAQRVFPPQPDLKCSSELEMTEQHQFSGFSPRNVSAETCTSVLQCTWLQDSAVALNTIVV